MELYSGKPGSSALLPKYYNTYLEIEFLDVAHITYCKFLQKISQFISNLSDPVSLHLFPINLFKFIFRNLFVCASSQNTGVCAQLAVRTNVNAPFSALHARNCTERKWSPTVSSHTHKHVITCRHALWQTHAINLDCDSVWWKGHVFVEVNVSSSSQDMKTYRIILVTSMIFTCCILANDQFISFICFLFLLQTQQFKMNVVTRTSLLGYKAAEQEVLWKSAIHNDCRMLIVSNSCFSIFNFKGFVSLHM